MPRGGRPVVVVTRAEAPEAAFRECLDARGIDVEWLQTIAVGAPDEPWLLDGALKRLLSFDWVVFTSGHGVEAVVTHPRWLHAWRLSPSSRPRLAAVGPATASRLIAHGHVPDLQAHGGGGAGLADELRAAHGGTLNGVRLLWPCSSIARREFAERVQAEGGALTSVVAYRTVPVATEHTAGFLSDLRAHVIDAVAFFSPSAASSLAASLGGSTLAVLAGQTLVASIGPTTSSDLRKLGAPPDIEARPNTALALAGSLAQRLGH